MLLCDLQCSFSVVLVFVFVFFFVSSLFSVSDNSLSIPFFFVIIFVDTRHHFCDKTLSATHSCIQGPLVMSCDATQQYTRLLTSILDEVPAPPLAAKGTRAEDAQPFRLAPTLCAATTAFGTATAPLGLSCDDPDTESDYGDDCDTPAGDALSELSEDGLLTPYASGSEDEDAGLRAPKQSCARTLQLKADAVLDRICHLLRPASHVWAAGDAADRARLAAAVAVLGRCCALPEDLKLALLWRSAHRRCTTDAMLRCFLTTDTSTATLRRLVAAATRGALPPKPSWAGDACGEEGEEQDSVGSDCGCCCATEAAANLRTLSLRGCAGVTDAGLRTVAACCRALRTLDLADCRNVTAAGLQALVRASAALGRLELGGCPALTDETVPVVFRYHCPPHIRALGVRRCGLHDAGLARLASYCPTLQELDVRGCGLLTARGFDALAQRVPSLRVLAGSECLGLDDRALAHVARGYGASLTDVRLALCCHVTSAGVAALAHHCQRLRSLDLRACTRVDDAALAALAASPATQASLVRLNLDECDVGDDALEELVACCPALAFVSVVGCPRITYPRALRLAHLAHVQIVM